MHQIIRGPRPSRTDRQYVVYFYESGLSRQYQQRQKDLLAAVHDGPAPTYDFTSDLVGPTRRYGPFLTVEKIIQSGYLAIPHSDPVEAIIRDRQDTSRLGLDDVISQIRQRYEVYERNVYEIEISKCATINSIYAHQAYHGPTYSKFEYAVSKRLDKLYEQQRLERTNFWRDVSKLRLLVPEQAQQYLAAYRKVSVLNEPGEGLP